MRRALRLVALCLGLAAWGAAVPQIASASSDTVELPAGDVVFVPDDRVPIEAQEIVLSRDAVRTTYAVRNRTPEPITRMMAWPLPEIDTNTLGDDVVVLASGDAQNFVATAVTVDGVPVALEFEQRATAFARDITALLDGFGVAPNPKAGSVDEQLAGLSPERVVELEERGVVRRDDDRIVPTWAVKTTAFWRQIFAPDKILTLGLAFSPVTASGLWEPTSLAELKTAYCISDAQAAAIDALAASSGRGLVTHRLTYSMANSSGWWAPIPNFRLVIEKTSIETVVATCVNDLKPIGPTLLEALVRDFKPKDDIRVLFIN